MLVNPVKFKLEGKETDIIREFSNGDDKYLEKKIIIDKQGNIIKEKDIDNEVIGKDNYNKTRRIMRGLFKSNKGILINSDVNGAYNIMRKVFPEAFKVDEIEGVDLHPVRVSIAC